uniref:pyridoxamine 5'-phosphate oxidase family protein n=1 Tax=Variovorax sp. BK018 TaxID=3450241 RepID=UPI004039F472
MNHPFGQIVNPVKRLREILPRPHDDALGVLKVTEVIDANAAAFIKHSPYVLIASSNAAGKCNVSPRGGAPGFVKIVDEQHLLIAEASGNRRADNISFMMENPHIGMLLKQDVPIPRSDCPSLHAGR